MAIYGSVAEADAYFESRLHSSVWSDASVLDKPKALLEATRIIDQLTYKGHKAPVYALLTASSLATDAEIQTADQTQALQFPRDTDTEVPEPIEIACYEIAYSLLDGKDPELELEALAISGHKFASIGTNYFEDKSALEHYRNGVPSMKAWILLKPFLRDNNELHLLRVS